MHRRTCIGALSIVLTTGCAATPSGPFEVSCDGDPTSIQYAFQTTGGGLIEEGSAVVQENGSRFFVITGDCRYWAFGARVSRVSSMSPTHTGLLNEIELRALHDRIRLYEHSSQQVMLAGVADASVDSLTDGRTTIACPALCSFEGAPAELAPVYESAMEILDELFELGTPVEAPSVRVAVARQDFWSTRWEWPEAEWPLDIPITEFERDAYGGNRRVDGEGALALRELRRRAYAGEFQPPGMGGGFIPVRVDGELWGVFVRDVIDVDAPDTGLWRVP